MINKSNLSLIIALVATYMGSIIGAGFASGQEILQFFILFGYKGLLGVVVATFFFVYLGATILRLSVQLRTSNYQELLGYLLGPWAGKFMDLISIFMLVTGLGVMLSGTGAVAKEYLGLPEWIGIGSAVLVIFFVILRGLKGLLSINIILVPVKLAAVCLIACLALAHKGLPQELPYVHYQGVGGHWLIASILYVSFNMIVPLAVLSTMGRSITAKTGIWAGIIGGIGLGVAVAMVTLSGLAFYPEIINYEIPLLYMASCVSTILKPVFALLIWIAMLTTAIANAHGFASRFAPQGGKRYRIYGMASCLIVLPLTYFDFSFLVRVLYPLFGYAGLVLFVALLIVPIIRTRKQKIY